MKKLFTLLTTLLITINVFSQAPEKISYQAVMRNAEGDLIQSSDVGIKITILKGSTDGTAVYSETHTVTTNTNGLVTLEIGTGETSDNFSIIDWGADLYFLKTETDPDGGINYTITGVSQILSVPYALYAKSAENGITNGSQIIQGDKTFTDAVIINTPVNANDAVNKAYVDALIANVEEYLISGGLVVKDIDGNVYKTVSIADQIWMAENLKTTKYNNGIEILLITDNSEWNSASNGAYCFYNNDADTYKNTYGALYNWYAINADSLCPTGWHVPIDEEWTTLIDFLGGLSLAGGKMKETGTIHWSSPNTGANNESGFTGLPGGFRFDDGSYFGMNTDAIWWSATADYLYTAWFWGLYFEESAVYKGTNNKEMGFSVRCIKN
jgi:uncharacterized protein (TIGR02145 family)